MRRRGRRGNASLEFTPPLPPQMEKKNFAFDIWIRYVVLFSRSECSVLSCQFSVDSCLCQCNVGQYLDVLQLKCNNEFFWHCRATYVVVNNMRRSVSFVRIHIQIEYST
jgi:hypothetical protein